MWNKRWMWILWPAFLAAAVMEVLVFAMFDPLDMQWLGQSLEFSRVGIYTVAFFVFWAVHVLAGFLTVLLSMPSSEVNARTASG